MNTIPPASLSRFSGNAKTEQQVANMSLQAIGHGLDYTPLSRKSILKKYASSGREVLSDRERKQKLQEFQKMSPAERENLLRTWREQAETNWEKISGLKA